MLCAVKGEKLFQQKNSDAVCEDPDCIYHSPRGLLRVIRKFEAGYRLDLMADP